MTPSLDRRTEKPTDYQQALRLAEDGRCREALTCIQEYLVSAPDDAEALNDTGAILFTLGEMQQAANHLVKARRYNPESAEIIWNLAEVWLADNDPEKAMTLYDDMEKMGILNADLLNRTADLLLRKENLTDALKVLERSLQVSPNQAVLHPMMEVIRNKMSRETC